MAVTDSPATNGHKSDKKSKKDKKERKRLRDEEDAEAGEERKHKRTKSIGLAKDEADDDDDDDEPPSGSQDLSLAASTATIGEPSPEKKKKKDKKHRKSVGEAGEDASDAERKEKKDKKKKRKSEHKEAEDGLEEPSVETTATAAAPASEKKEKKSKKAKAASPEPTADDDDDDAMDVDSPAKTKSTSRVHQPPDAPSKPQFPFFTQTVSLYLPLYPIGWDTPCTAAASQHLEPLVNRYVPELKGVLLAFRNVAVSEQPGRRYAATNDDERCDLVSVDEYAVGFGYVTVDVDLFVPRRGAWMEGSINLENEGHIGVVCWGKFNASIESARLPPEWCWVHAGSAEAASYVADPFDNDGGDGDGDGDDDGDDDGVVRQIHTTGFWVDGAGDKVKGRVRFRIKAFDVGVSGDHGYLSLEGTMLDAAGEKAAVQRDAEQERRRRAGKSGGAGAGGILAKERRRMPEFSVTKFGAVEDEEDKALRQDVWNTTEPVTDNEAGEKDAFAGISTEEA